jgi:hypothetical protein
MRSSPPLTSVALYLSIAVLLSFSWMFRSITVPNERTRVYLAVALVDDHTISINHSVERFGKTLDLAHFEGRYFTDKAPGSSLLGAVVYGAVRLFSPPDAWHIETLVNLMRSFLMIPFGLLGFWILRRWLRSMSIGQVHIDIVSVTWILGTSAFHYSASYYGHQLAAVGLLGAMYFSQRNGAGTTQHIRLLAAGASAGFAGLVEYQSIVPAVLCLFYVIWRYRAFKPVLFFVLGAAPFAFLLLGYNWAAFGGPFELSYHHLVSKKLQHSHSVGIGGVSTPKLPAIFGSLLSLHRGLLVTSPIFVLLPFGLRRMWIQGEQRALSVVIGCIVAFYLWFIFSADVWHAGWGFGPRLLIPMMPLTMVPIAFAAQRMHRSPWLWGGLLGLAVAGVVYQQMVHVVFAELPETAKNPMKDLIVPALQKGVLSPNLISWYSGHQALESLILPAVLLLVVLGVLISRHYKKNRLTTGLKISGSALLPIAALSLAIVLAPPSWTPSKTKRFLRWMNKLEKKEYAPREESVSH